MVHQQTLLGSRSHHRSQNGILPNSNVNLNVRFVLEVIGTKVVALTPQQTNIELGGMNLVRDCGLW